MLTFSLSCKKPWKPHITADVDEMVCVGHRDNGTDEIFFWYNYLQANDAPFIVDFNSCSPGMINGKCCENFPESLWATYPWTSMLIQGTDEDMMNAISYEKEWVWMSVNESFHWQRTTHIYPSSMYSVCCSSLFKHDLGEIPLQMCLQRPWFCSHIDPSGVDYQQQATRDDIKAHLDTCYVCAPEGTHRI